MRVAVIGAGGLTGLECVKQLHTKEGFDVVPIVRDAAKYEGKFPQGVTAVKVLKRISQYMYKAVTKPRSNQNHQQGDVVDSTSLSSALAGCDAVVYAASSSSYWAPEAVDYKVS